MRNIAMLCACCFILAGCGAATAPENLPQDGANRLVVVEKFARLDLLSGLEAGAIENSAANGLPAGDAAAMREALAAGLEAAGLLVDKPLPQSARLSLEVRDIRHNSSGTAVTVRMLIEDTHNWLVLGSADVVGRGPRGDARSAALSAVGTIVDIVAAKMKKPAA